MISISFSIELHELYMHLLLQQERKWVTFFLHFAGFIDIFCGTGEKQKSMQNGLTSEEQGIQIGNHGRR